LQPFPLSEFLSVNKEHKMPQEQAPPSSLLRQIAREGQPEETLTPEQIEFARVLGRVLANLWDRKQGGSSSVDADRPDSLKSDLR
jgi:hypothetical protein